MFNPDIFTEEVLNNMAPIVNDYFRFKPLDEIEEVEKQFDEIMDDVEEVDGMDASDFFDQE